MSGSVNGFVAARGNIVAKGERRDNGLHFVVIKKRKKYSEEKIFEGFFDFKKILAVPLDDDGKVFCIKNENGVFRFYEGFSIKSAILNNKCRDSKDEESRSVVESRSFLPLIKKEVHTEDILG